MAAVVSFLPAVRELFQPVKPASEVPALPPKRVKADATIERIVSFKTRPRGWRDPEVTWRFVVPNEEHIPVLVDALEASWRISDVKVER